MKRVRNNKTFKLFVDNLQDMVGYANAGYLVGMLGDVLIKFAEEGHRDIRDFEMYVNGITSLKLDFKTKEYMEEK